MRHLRVEVVERRHEAGLRHVGVDDQLVEHPDVLQGLVATTPLPALGPPTARTRRATRGARSPAPGRAPLRQPSSSPLSSSSSSSSSSPGAADHDLVLLDRDLDRPVAGPVLGVDRVVLDGGIEPQAVALLAVVERALERAGGGAACGARPPRRRGALGLSPSSSASASSSSSAARAASASAAFGGSSAARAPPRPSRGLGPRARRRSARRPRRADRSRRRSRAARAVGLAVRLEPLLALERLDLLHGDLELVRDPRVGATLSHPPADLVQLRSQGPAAMRAGD